MSDQYKKITTTGTLVVALTMFLIV